MKKSAEKVRRKPLRLKFQLLLVLIPLIFVYTWALTAINSAYIMNGTSGTLEKTLGETAKITSEHIEDSMDNNRKLTALLADRVGSVYERELTMPYEELDVEKFASELAQLGVEYGFLHMMAAGEDGYTRTLLHTNLREKNADYYAAIVNDGKESYVSDVSVDQGSFAGKYVLNYSAPIKNSRGSVIGVLICKSDAAELSALVSDICVGDGGSTFIMDSKGQCIAHKDPAMLFSGATFLEYNDNVKYPSLNALWDAMASESSGYMSYEYDEGRIAAFSRVGGTNNWSVAVSVSETEFMGGAIEARNAATWIGLGMIAIFSLILVLLFRYTTKGVGAVTSRLESLSGGNLGVEFETDRSSEETYRLSLAAAKLAGVIKGMIRETEHALGEIAKGNLMVEPGIEYAGDFAAIKVAIESNLARLNEMIRSISRTSEEVARGSAQMASGAAGLAQGASEQASSLEELFETVTTLAQRTYEIGGVDKRRLAEAQESDGAETGEQDASPSATLAEKLTLAIARIADASRSIRRIASDIESISAETGMLALNASVEATHAGDAGRGFSVIASEIRGLSDKSRGAAKDADDKIDSITRAINRGTQTVELTVSTISEMTAAMEQVKSALEQISNIVENIAATAQETAAGSEELSAQAELMKSLVAEFRYRADD